jgi:hypothetical protein
MADDAFFGRAKARSAAAPLVLLLFAGALITGGCQRELDSDRFATLSQKAKHQRFVEKAISLTYPTDATDVHYYISPQDFHGDQLLYLRFTASEPQIRAFLIAEFGSPLAPASHPSDHNSIWHYYLRKPWWVPPRFDSTKFYEAGIRFATVDWKNLVVYYSRCSS